MTRLRRVALILASSTGGTGRHVACLAEGLTKAGVAVTVCGPAATEARFGFIATGADFRCVEIPPTPHLGDIAAVRAFRGILRAASTSPWGEGHPYDVVHAHGLRAGVVAAWARPPGIPLVVTWHNLVLFSGVRGGLYRRLERYVARAADVTLGVSSDLVCRARAWGARRVILAAVPAPALSASTRSRERVREEFAVDGDCLLIFSAGRLHPQKGYEVLIDAAARWRTLCPPPVVIIAGDGPARHEIAARIAASGAPVRLVGHRNDIADVLAAADIVVTTSVWEGQPLFVQETLRAGVPMVATAVGGIPDVAGDAALLVPAGDVDAVDKAVRRLIDDSQLRAEYARRGRAQAETWPTEGDAVAQVMDVYSEVIATNGGGRD